MQINANDMQRINYNNPAVQSDIYNNRIYCWPKN